MDFAATPSAAADPHPVLGHSGPGHWRQVGDVGEIHTLFGQLTPTGRAGLQDHRHVHGGSVISSGPGACRKEKVPSPGMRPGRLGCWVRVPLEKGVAWRRTLLLSCSFSVAKASLRVASSATRSCSIMTCRCNSAARATRSSRLSEATSSGELMG